MFYVEIIPFFQTKRELKQLDANTYTFRTKIEFKQLEREGGGGGGGGVYEQMCNPSKNAIIQKLQPLFEQGRNLSNYTAIFPAFKLKVDFEVLHYIFIIKYFLFWGESPTLHQRVVVRRQN